MKGFYDAVYVTNPNDFVSFPFCGSTFAMKTAVNFKKFCNIIDFMLDANRESIQAHRELELTWRRPNGYVLLTIIETIVSKKYILYIFLLF